jgi:hypothetical protein
MHNDLGLRSANRDLNRLGIESVCDDGLGTHRANRIDPPTAARHPDHLIAISDQQPHQLPPDRPCRTGHEHPHPPNLHPT